MLSSSRGQGSFRGLEASRPRTSKCVLEAKDVLKDSTSDFNTSDIRGGVEDTRLEAKDTKKSEAKDTGASVLKRKKGLQIFFSSDLRKRETKKRSSQIFREVSGAFLHNLKNEQIKCTSHSKGILRYKPSMRGSASELC